MMKQFGLLLVCLLMGCAGQPPASIAKRSGADDPVNRLVPSTMDDLSPKAATIPITSTSADAIAQFKKGRELFENLRQGEALEYLKKAIQLDNNFAQAHAYAGFLMTGAEALAELDKAEALASTVPEAERLNILSMVADRRGDDRRVAKLTTKLVELLPGDWRAHWYKGMRGRLARSAIHGQALPDAAGLEEVTASLRRAVELNPMAGAVHNQLGYLSLLRGRKDEAIAAFENYIRVAPNEPNAYDSLGDALLAANRLEEAEAQFKKALEVSPRFWQSWGGIAATRALRGDWKGAYEALNSSTQSAVRPSDKLETKRQLGWTQFTEGNVLTALDTAMAAEREAKTLHHPGSFTSSGLDGAEFLFESGRAKDALKKLDDVMSQTESEIVPGETLSIARRRSFVIRATVEDSIGRQDEVARSLSLLETEAEKLPDSLTTQSQVAYVRGLVALSRGDSKQAVSHFSMCIAQHVYCKWRQIQAFEKLGDNVGAEVATRKIVETPTRETEYLYVRAKLGTIPTIKQVAVP